MGVAFFEVGAESGATNQYHSTAHTGGPWSPDHQHGGPPAALLVQCCERAAEAETGRSDLVALRLSAEFVGPVPVAPVEVTTRVVRAARTAVLVTATLASGGRDCLHGRVWLVRDEDTESIATPLVAPEPVDGPDGQGVDFPYARAIEWRRRTGSVATPGPGMTWARPRIDVVAGRSVTGLQRAALIGDSASGLSSELDWSHWSFLNVDLDIHLARPVRGEWVLMDAVTQLGAHGSALAQSTLSDVYGRVGATMQTLVLAPLRR